MKNYNAYSLFSKNKSYILTSTNAYIHDRSIQYVNFITYAKLHIHKLHKKNLKLQASTKSN